MRSWASLALRSARIYREAAHATVAPGPQYAAPPRWQSVRYSPEVVAYFKSTGEGWQSRMDSVLRKYVARHSRGV